MSKWKLIKRLNIIFFLLSMIMVVDGFSQKKEKTRHESTISWAQYMLVDPAPTIFNTVPFDETEKFKTCTASEKEIREAIAHLQSNYFLSIEEQFGDKKLKFSATFPQGFDEDFNHIRIQLYDTSIKNSSGENLRLKSSGFPANRRRNKQMKLGVLNKISRYEKWDKLASGKIVYEVKFLTDYGKLEVKKSDIGKEIDYLGAKIKVIDIYDNKVVFECLTPNRRSVHFYGYTNFDASGDNQYLAYSRSEFKELAKNGETYRNVDRYQRQFVVNKKLYEFFRKNPKADVDLLHSTFSEKELEKMHLGGEHYFVVYLDAPVVNKVLFYNRVYGVNEKIEAVY